MRAQSTIHPRIGQSRAVIPAILAAALVLGGCAATHVGDAWQCPLAQGAACTSVAEADPAVAAPGKAQGLAIRTPLYQSKTGNAKGPAHPAPKAAIRSPGSRSGSGPSGTETAPQRSPRRQGVLLPPRPLPNRNPFRRTKDPG